MFPRFFVDEPLFSDTELTLSSGSAHHVRVLRLQPGNSVRLFNGHGGEFSATVIRMRRGEVTVQVGAHDPVERELARPIALAVGMPANERMDALIEKSTELGMAEFVPLICERAVLRLHGERAEKKVIHWRGVAAAACEQCGRTRLPVVMSVCGLADWLQALPPPSVDVRWVLSLADTRPLLQQAARETGQSGPVTVLSGPEGGLSKAEEALARQHGFIPVSLGPRILRADTAPLAALAYLNGLSPAS